jgi:transglutaminase-like putative cysteine protease/tetratricopeptide (TPR) repeat protein
MRVFARLPFWAAAVPLGAALFAPVESPAAAKPPGSSKSAPAATKGAPPEARPVSSAAAPAPWESAFLESKPADLVSAAKLLPSVPDEDFVVLLEEGSFRWDAEGRLEYRYRYAVRIDTLAGVDEWKELESGWSPWRQKRPEIRARIVSADGSEHRLDPKTLSERSAARPDDGIYSDRRVLRAPLPAIAPGSVLEAETTVVDTEPVLAGGGNQEFFFGRTDVPMRRVRLVLDAPASLPLRAKAFRLENLAPKRTERDGRVEIVYDATALPKVEPGEPSGPDDLPTWPVVRFSTGASWQEIASRYGAIVDDRIRKVDLRSTAKGAAAGAKGREAIASRLLAWLRKNVRYEALELGQASVVPRLPNETMTRKFGDCKDQATLLVALLRALGQPASVALLSTRPGADVDPELPGFNDFDHAIVAVSGNPTLWIDTTNELSRAGELPPGDSGRLALIAEANSTGLVRTPELRPAANRVVETRTIHLAEQGAARIVELSEATGALDQELRGIVMESAEQNREALLPYVRNMYNAEELTAVKHPDPFDLQLPFRIELDAAKCRVGFTSSKEAVAWLSPSLLLDRFPGALSGVPDEEEKKPKPRRSPFRIPLPFEAVWRYRIVPPAGYEALPLPPRLEKKIGPVVLTGELRLEGKDVVGEIRCDSGPLVWSPEEVEAFRVAAEEFRSDDAILVNFESVADRLVRAGRAKDALAEHRKLAALHPKEALHHARLAETLLQMGLGEAARSEAKRATAIEEKSAESWRSLARVLEHDLIGRPFVEGSDRVGAIAAWRKAMELEPKDPTAGASLVELLSRGDGGILWGEGADYAGALAEIEKLEPLLDERGTASLRTSRLLSLLYLRRWAELEKEARSGKMGDVSVAVLLVAIAEERGGEAAIRESRRLGIDDAMRRRALALASGDLVRMRGFDLARAFLAEAAAGNREAADLRSRADLLQKVRPWNEALSPDSDPRGVVERALCLATAKRPEGEISPLLSRRAPSSAWKWLEEFGTGFRRALTAKAGASLPGDVAADLMLGSAQLSVDGEGEGGRRVRYRSGTASDVAFFVVPEEGKLRILGVNPELSLFGREALAALDRKELAEASRWLDWASELGWSGTGDDPLSGDPAVRAWGAGSRSEADARLAAACALTEGGALERIDAKEKEARRQELETALRILTPLEGDAVLTAKIQALFALERNDAALAIAELGLSRYPNSAIAFHWKQQALRALGRSAEYLAAAEKRIAKGGGEEALNARFAAEVEAESGNVAGAIRRLSRLAEEGKAGAPELNDLAWMALFVAPVAESAAEHARKSVELGRAPGNLHTLAAVAAELGRIDEAIEALRNAVSLGGGSMAEHDWYVVGRIAEQLGERDWALAAFRRLEKPKNQKELPLSTWRLADRRIAALGKGKKG